MAVQILVNGGTRAKRAIREGENDALALALAEKASPYARETASHEIQGDRNAV